MNRTSWLMLVIAVIAASAITYYFTRGGVSYIQGGPPRSNPRTTVPLSLDLVSGTCQPSDPPQLRVPSTPPRPTITWQVTNNCGTPQWIQLTNFRKKDETTGKLGSQEHITDPDAPIREIPAVTPTAVPIQAVLVITVTTVTTYKYDIMIGPAQNQLHKGLDPDMEIWP